MHMDRLTKAYLDLSCGLSVADAQELARRELEMRKQFQTDWKSGRVRHEEKLYAAAMRRQRSAAPAAKGRRPPDRSVPCADHEGRKFKNLKEMCTFYKIEVNTYVHRVQRGLSLKEALTNPVVKKYIDPAGHEFATEREMCKAWGINLCTYRQRRARGNDLKTALTKPLQRGCYKEVTDPKGRKFKSVKAMCKAWGIRYLTYLRRVKRGDDTATALRPTASNLRGLFKELGAFVKE